MAFVPNRPKYCQVCSKNPAVKRRHLTETATGKQVKAWICKDCDAVIMAKAQAKRDAEKEKQAAWLDLMKETDQKDKK